MTLRACLITLITFLGLIIGLIGTKTYLNHKLTQEKVLFEKLRKDAIDYKILKSLDHSMFSLEKTIDNLNSLVKPTQQQKNTHFITLHYEQLTQVTMTSLFQAFQSSGHLLQKINISKHENIFSLSLDVYP
jgi:hypothetical protein